MNVALRVQGADGAHHRTSFRERAGNAFSKKNPKRNRNIILTVATAAAILFVVWLIFGSRGLPDGFASGNGRLEANEVYVASKYSGRVAEVLVDEGDTVSAGQVVARMDTETLQAQLRQAGALLRQSESAKEVALAQIAAAQADYTYAEQQNRRSRQLVRGGSISEQEAQVDAARSLTARADLTGARARAVEATSNIEAAQAEVERLQSEINDAVLKSPIRGRVETRLAEPGEVLTAGGRVFSLVDLSDVYMYIFLPERIAGRIAIGSEARIVLDAAPNYPIQAAVSFVSPVAQFTPRAVETQEERHNLTFRVRLQIPRERLQQYEALVKTGIPGMGYVRFDQSARWPSELAGGRPPPANLWAPTGSAPAAPAPEASDQPAPSGSADIRGRR
jgi:HlyD family secretion protein